MKMFARIMFLPLVAMMILAGCAPAEKPADSGAPDVSPREAREAAKEATPEPAPAPAEPTPAPAEPAPAAPTEPAAAPMTEPAATTPDSAAPAPAEPAAAAGPALDATTIVGTKWSAAGYTLDFQANGVLKINDDTEGSWKLDGNKLTIDAGGSVYEATVEGDKVMYEGSPLEKIN